MGGISGCRIQWKFNVTRRRINCARPLKAGRQTPSWDGQVFLGNLGNFKP